MAADTDMILPSYIERTGGVLRMVPNFQARFYRDGGRFPGVNRGDGMPVDELGNFIDERWLFSITRIEQEGASGEDGLSTVADEDGSPLCTLDALVRAHPDVMLGADYVAAHGGPGVAIFELLAKILDIGSRPDDRINCHIHPRKDEAYYYPSIHGQDDVYLAMGFFGGTRDRVRQCLENAVKGERVDSILHLQPHFRLKVGSGWHVYAGMPHSPVGYVFELQRPRDDFRLLQLYHRGQDKLFEPDLLLRGDESVEAAMADIDWAMAENPYIWHLFHVEPERIEGTSVAGVVEERWVFNPNRTRLWSGKEVVLEPRKAYTSREQGAYGLFVFTGEGIVAGLDVAAGDPKRDELFVSHRAATAGVEVTNTGDGPLVFYTFFPADVNTVPLLYDDQRFREWMAVTGIEPRGY